MISCIQTPGFIIVVLITVLYPFRSLAADTRTLYQSVERALNDNPQMQVLSHNLQAVQYDLRQKRGGYLPTVDLLLGYGMDQYSDQITRRTNADPSASDWDSRGDAALVITQKVYDGGETGSQVSIQSALLDSAGYQLRATAQAIALKAVTAHLNVFRQRELVALTEKNLKNHRDIHQLLAERERAGAGSIADVTLVQARLARAESTLYLNRADLSRAMANYVSIIGTTPEELAYAGAPDGLPQTLEEALRLTEQGNPELMVLDAELNEAESRLALARSRFKPKIDIELSSRYNDQLEGDPSWQNTNAAMLILHGNIFNGGQDEAGKDAAISRTYQSRAKRSAKLIELTEAMSSSWANYFALQQQKIAYRDAVDYSLKTLDAYMKQFSVSQRSLLDLLSVENDYFQSAVQLITADINETISAYQILALTGSLKASSCSGVGEYPDYLLRLKNRLCYPLAQQNP